MIIVIDNMNKNTQKIHIFSVVVANSGLYC